MISSVAVINSRHFLYGAVLSQYLNKLNCYWRVLLSYLMTDQAFSVSLSYFKKNKKNKCSFSYAWVWLYPLVFVADINFGGIILGNIVPEQLGLTFAIPLTFLSFNYFELRKIDHLIVICISG